MTIGSLFSGIGGLELGLERAGLGPVKWQVEIDEYCRGILARHWPDATRWDDVRRCKGWGTGYVGPFDYYLGAVDLICGGFPCQPFSVAGQQRGEDDPRHLWPEFIRIVREIKPRWVVAENVPGLLSVDAGRQFGVVVGDLAESGYRVWWDCIPAAAFGAPHMRDRVFILGYAYGQSQPACAVNDEAPGMQELASDAHDGRDDQQFSAGFLEGKQPQNSIKQRSGGPGPDWGCDWWQTEPNVDRVANGIPRQLDRLRALGNAVVPAVAEYIGRCVIHLENELCQKQQ